MAHTHSSWCISINSLIEASVSITRVSTTRASCDASISSSPPPSCLLLEGLPSVARLLVGDLSSVIGPVSTDLLGLLTSSPAAAEAALAVRAGPILPDFEGSDADDASAPPASFWSTTTASAFSASFCFCAAANSASAAFSKARSYRSFSTGSSETAFSSRIRQLAL